MPYKHIAAQLKKTELACRLHYHQLSFGNRRRRRATSDSSARRIERSPSAPSNLRHDLPQRTLPSFTSMEMHDPLAPPSHEMSASAQSHIPILPKPTTTSRRASLYGGGLRLVTQGIERFREESSIDLQKLDHLYDAHRGQFWTTIARNYSSDISPLALEEAWQRSHGINFSNVLPTPADSPRSPRCVPIRARSAISPPTDYGNGFTPINPMPRSSLQVPASAIERSGCSIASILTDDRDVRSPSAGKRAELAVAS